MYFDSFGYGNKCLFPSIHQPTQIHTYILSLFRFWNQKMLKTTKTKTTATTITWPCPALPCFGLIPFILFFPYLPVGMYTLIGFEVANLYLCFFFPVETDVCLYLCFLGIFWGLLSIYTRLGNRCMYLYFCTFVCFVVLLTNGEERRGYFFSSSSFLSFYIVSVILFFFNTTTTR